MNRMKNMCRTCLLETGEMRSLFATGTIMGETARLSEVMLACANLKIGQDDGLPQQICLRCVHQVSRAFTFRRQCERNQEILLQQLNDNTKESSNDLPFIGEEITITNSDKETISKDIAEEIIIDCTYEPETSDPETINVAEKSNPNVMATLTKIINNNSKLNKSHHECKTCGKKFLKFTSLKIHFLQEHRVITNKLKCTLCNKICRTEEQLKRHTNIHETGKPFKCETCLKCFQQRAAYVAHTYSHTGERPFLCTECGKSFKQNSELKIHMRVHLDLRPYSCDICGKAYRNSSLFSIHKRVHSGERPFACTYCDKKFISSSCLKNHVMIHTGEKPYTCDYCGRSFNRSNALNIHRKIHTGERPHVCQICGKGFIQAHCLQSHLNTHKAI